MTQMAFCDLSHTFHKQVTNISQHVFVILLWGILMSPLTLINDIHSLLKKKKVSEDPYLNLKYWTYMHEKQIPISFTFTSSSEYHIKCTRVVEKIKVQGNSLRQNKTKMVF